ncbi:MAG: mechanosensitive ion channel family protein [Planctomycetota bacterium]|nr:mechanosensitive ion channel family protein [Planctomycetota bacterium]
MAENKLKIGFSATALIWCLIAAALMARSSASSEGEAAPQAADNRTAAVAAADADAQVVQALRQPLRSVEGYSLYGLEAWRLLVAAFLLIIAFALSNGLKYMLRKSAAAWESAESKAQAAMRDLFLGATLLPLRLVVWAAAIRLLLPLFWREQIGVALWAWEVVLSAAVAVFFYDLVDVVEQAILRYGRRTDHRGLCETLAPMVRKTLRAVVLVLAGLQIYHSVTGQSVGAILAGLGLSGMALALAAQDTLKNFFGFVSLVIDRPYVVGDWIAFGAHEGVVESVSFRSTRIRRLDGSLVAVPNSHAVSSVIHNLGRRPYFRRYLRLYLRCDTPPMKVERALAIMREVLQDHEGMKPDMPPRVFFEDFSERALILAAYYWYQSADFWRFWEHAARVNAEILQRFHAEGIALAFLPALPCCLPTSAAGAAPPA